MAIYHSMDVKVEFEGGLQTDFEAPNGITVKVPEETTLGKLAPLVLEQFGKGKAIRFVGEGGAVVPGILIMLNDTDSEIEGLDTVLKPGDSVTYISTLHGG